MLINYTLDKENHITSWTSFPIDENKPMIEVPENFTCVIGKDKLVGNKFIADSEYRRIQSVRLQIEENKKALAESDYKLLKYLEGELSEDEAEKLKLERSIWRLEINALEESIK